MSEFFKLDADLSVLLQLEIARMHLFYHEVLPSDQALKSAFDSAELSINLTGKVLEIYLLFRCRHRNDFISDFP